MHKKSNKAWPLYFGGAAEALCLAVLRPFCANPVGISADWVFASAGTSPPTVGHDVHAGWSRAVRVGLVQNCNQGTLTAGIGLVGRSARACPKAKQKLCTSAERRSPWIVQPVKSKLWLVTATFQRWKLSLQLASNRCDAGSEYAKHRSQGPRYRPALRKMRLQNGFRRSCAGTAVSMQPFDLACAVPVMAKHERATY
jgi:hypothetical protein